jgi:hypothetical protein
VCAMAELRAGRRKERGRTPWRPCSCWGEGLPAAKRRGEWGLGRERSRGRRGRRQGDASALRTEGGGRTTVAGGFNVTLQATHWSGLGGEHAVQASGGRALAMGDGGRLPVPRGGAADCGVRARERDRKRDGCWRIVDGAGR